MTPPFLPSQPGSNNDLRGTACSPPNFRVLTQLSVGELVWRDQLHHPYMGGHPIISVIRSPDALRATAQSGPHEALWNHTDQSGRRLVTMR